jgi:hypothetical protein
MSRRSKKSEPAPALGERSARGPSTRVALQISLGFHALFVLMLFRLYSEYTIERHEPIRIVASSTAPRDAATPSFVAVPSAEATAEESPRPVARGDALPQRSTSFADTPVVPISSAVSSSRRRTAPAVLPVAGVTVPAAVTADLEVSTSAPTTAAAPQSTATLARTDTTSDLELRIALRTVYGPRPQRPIGMALLPETGGLQPRLEPTHAFAHRRAGLRLPPQNRTAIDRGLEFLVRVQLDDGRWQFRHLRAHVDPSAEPPGARADAAATGLALLAFLGAGHDHLDGRYHRVVDDAIQFLIRTQKSDGEFFPDDGPVDGELTRFYSHGIATLALSEAFGMTGDERLRGPAQRALDFLAGSHRNVPGAWRFLPGLDADSATISWQLATLRSGQLAGLHVEERTIEAAKAYVVRMREAEGQASTATTTAVDLAMQLHLGGSRNNAQLRPAAETLLAHPPEFVREPEPGTELVELPTDSPSRDTYYWYYGSEAMFYLGGEDWQTWSRQLYPQLIETQVSDGPLAGSWDPKINLSSNTAGRLYVTAMNLLSLEIQNRHLSPANVATVPDNQSRELTK